MTRHPIDALRQMVADEIKRTSRAESFMVRSGLLADLLDELTAYRAALSSSSLSDLHPLGQEYDGDALRELRLADALAPFAAVAEKVSTFAPDNALVGRFDFTAGDYRRAARALSATPPAQEGVEISDCAYCGAQVALMGADYLDQVMEALDRISAPRKSPDGLIHYGITDRIAALATTAPTVDETDRLREEIGSAEWLNLMPREVVARAALNEGCRDKTADDIRHGLHGDVKIRAEIAVKLVGFIQNQVRAALSDRPQAGGGR